MREEGLRKEYQHDHFEMINRFSNGSVELTLDKECRVWGRGVDLEIQIWESPKFTGISQEKLYPL